MIVCSALCSVLVVPVITLTQDMAPVIVQLCYKYLDIFTLHLIINIQ